MQQNLIKCLYYYQFLFDVNQSNTIFIKKHIDIYNILLYMLMLPRE